MIFRLFERLIKPFPMQDDLQPPTGLWAFCRFYSQGAGKFLLLMALFTALIAIIEASLFGMVGELVDFLAKADPKLFWQTYGSQAIVLALGCLLGIPLIVTIHSLLVHQTLLGNYPMRIRWMAHRYLLGQSLAFYQDDLAGRVATKVMQTSLAVREAVMKLLDVILFITVFFVSAVVLVGSIDLRLAAPMVLWVVLYCCTLLFFLPRLKQISQQQADARATMTGAVVDSYTNISTIKLFSHAKRESGYARESMEGFLNTVHPQMRLVTWLNLCVWTLNVSLLVGLTGLSIYLWTLEQITSGAIAVALGLSLRLNGMSQWIMWEISALFEHIGTVQDGMNTLARPQQIKDLPSAQPLQAKRGEIEFKDLHFCYGDQQIFQALNLHIQPGEKVGLVGRSGAGKSTLVNLLLRFYDLDGGAIRVDGQDVKEVQQDSLRAQVGMVTQDTSLLHRPVRDNILFGRPDASEAELVEAAKRAEAYEFIQTLEDAQGNRGFDAMVGERGVKLSGGQRQRIAIARVLLKDAPILVLDEATSALDSEVEMAIQRSLDQLMEGKTVIAIAHRLSTIAALDRLIVLDQGQIIEQGSHQQLLMQGGVYARLWHHQSGGFLGLD